jgi:hypothetical protein
MTVEPGHLSQRRQFDRPTVFSRRTTMNQFRLVQAVDRFSQRVVVAASPAADRLLDACLSQPFAVANMRSPASGCHWHDTTP